MNCLNYDNKNKNINDCKLCFSQHAHISNER